MLELWRRFKKKFHLLALRLRFFERDFLMLRFVSSPVLLGAMSPAADFVSSAGNSQPSRTSQHPGLHNELPETACNTMML